MVPGAAWGRLAALLRRISRVHDCPPGNAGLVVRSLVRQAFRADEHTHDLGHLLGYAYAALPDTS
jgi:hypothetical protein